MAPCDGVSLNWCGALVQSPQRAGSRWTEPHDASKPGAFADAGICSGLNLHTSQSVVKRPNPKPLFLRVIVICGIFLIVLSFLLR